MKTGIPISKYRGGGQRLKIATVVARPKRTLRYASHAGGSGSRGVVEAPDRRFTLTSSREPRMKG